MLGVNAADSSHFKRNVENKLKTWGYGFAYERAGVTILRRPALPEERLRELLIRKLDLDVQNNAIAFARFVDSFRDDLFASMPWQERAVYMRKNYGIEVSERTLRRWFSKLIKNEIAVKGEERTYWCTEKPNWLETIRSPATKEEYDSFLARRSEILKV